MSQRSILVAFAVAFLAMFASSSLRAAVQVKEVQYRAGDQQLKGYLAYDDATNDKRPGILVFPEWWGMTDYPKMRAQKLAELGYVAFVADLYGEGKSTDDPKQAGAWSGEASKDRHALDARVKAALDQLKAQPQVDPNKIGAIGYCFGGTVALTLAVTNFDDLKGVVSFHGGLGNVPKPGEKPQAKILVCTGAADSMNPQEQVKQFEESVRKAGGDIRVITYPGAHHSFTNPNADAHHMDNIKYNKAADEKSWEDMKQFFADVFGK